MEIDKVKLSLRRLLAVCDHIQAIMLRLANGPDSPPLLELRNERAVNFFDGVGAKFEGDDFIFQKIASFTEWTSHEAEQAWIAVYRDGTTPEFLPWVSSAADFAGRALTVLRNDVEMQLVWQFLDSGVYEFGKWADAIPKLIDEYCPADGPVEPDGFRWAGVLHKGLAPNQWRLLDLLWSSPRQSALIDGMDVTVWCSPDYEFTGNPLKQLCKKVRKWLKDNQIPLTIKDKSESLRTVLLEPISLKSAEDT